MRTVFAFIFLIMAAPGFCAEERIDEKRIQAAIAEMENETPNVIISFGRPVIFGVTPAMKKVTEFGLNGTKSLWHEITKRENPKIVAMCATCIQKIRAEVGADAIEHEIIYWEGRPNINQADLAIVSLRRLKMELENKIKKSGAN